MATEPDASRPDLNKMSTEMFRTWEKAMGAWWDQVLESPSFLGQVNSGMGQAARARGAWTDAVDKSMEAAHLPSRTDVVRMLKVATLLEERLLAQEDVLLELKDRLATAEKDALAARIESAETRLELGDKLDTILAHLGAAPRPAEAAAGTAEAAAGAADTAPGAAEAAGDAAPPATRTPRRKG